MQYIIGGHHKNTVAAGVRNRFEVECVVWISNQINIKLWDVLKYSYSIQSLMDDIIYANDIYDSVEKISRYC